ncbi:hypothetical protein [Microvirga sp. GCM10011540]|uniref:hypothetical protein n=1 Tax=Microvirga sp. GCM10011540 TaxID=3317338 RepID=UPI00366F5CCE
MNASGGINAEALEQRTLMVTLKSVEQLDVNMKRQRDTRLAALERMRGKAYTQNWNDQCPESWNFIRRITVSKAIVDRGRFRFAPGNTRSPLRTSPILTRISLARRESGTRCSRPTFIRPFGTVQIPPSAI